MKLRDEIRIRLHNLTLMIDSGDLNGEQILAATAIIETLRWVLKRPELPIIPRYLSTGEIPDVLQNNEHCAAATIRCAQHYLDDHYEKRIEFHRDRGDLDAKTLGTLTRNKELYVKKVNVAADIFDEVFGEKYDIK